MKNIVFTISMLITIISLIGIWDDGINGAEPPSVLPQGLTLQELQSRDAVDLDGKVTYQWSYGCSPTAVAEILAWYDRLGFEDFYTGFGGTAPLIDAWGVDPSDSYNHDNPISASKFTVAGYSGVGHVGDYWFAEVVVLTTLI